MHSVNPARPFSRRSMLAAGALACSSLLFGGCSHSSSDPVIIFPCLEGERSEAMLSAMGKDLPDVEVLLRYKSTGDLSSRLLVEGTGAECDIVVALEAGYMMSARTSLEDLTSRYDFSVFCDDLRVDPCIMPFTREAGSFATNPKVLARSGVDQPPISMDDLLDRSYQGLITIPDPSSSSTGYNLLWSLVRRLGQKRALEWMDELAANVYQFTSSGAAPASALTQGEAGVGLSLIFSLVSERSQGSPLELSLFHEGCPWTMNGVGVVQGHGRPEVWRVMDWIFERGIMQDKELFVPDKVFEQQNTSVDGWPTDLVYADMEGLFDPAAKKKLLERWEAR